MVEMTFLPLCIPTEKIVRENNVREDEQYEFTSLYTENKSE